MKIIVEFSTGKRIDLTRAEADELLRWNGGAGGVPLWGNGYSGGTPYYGGGDAPYPGTGIPYIGAPFTTS